MKKKVRLVVLLTLLTGLGLSLPVFAIPTVQIGQNISVLTKGLVITGQGVKDFGCNRPIVITGYAVSKDADQNTVQLYVFAGQASNTLALVFDESDNPSVLYVADKNGKIFKVIDGNNLPDDPCGLF